MANLTIIFEDNDDGSLDIRLLLVDNAGLEEGKLGTAAYDAAMQTMDWVRDQCENATEVDQPEAIH